MSIQGLSASEMANRVKVISAGSQGNTTTPVSTTDNLKEATVQGGESFQQVRKKMQEDPSYIPTLQEQTVINAIEQANKKILGSGREFEFSIHEKTKQIMVKVINAQTKEVVREIPSEKILDMVASMCELAGLFVDEKR